MAQKKACLITAEVSNALNSILHETSKEVMATTPEGLVVWYARENAKQSEELQLSASKIAHYVNQAFSLHGDDAFSYQRVTRIVSNGKALEKVLSAIRDAKNEPISAALAAPCVDLSDEHQLLAAEAIPHGVGTWVTYHHPGIADALLQVMEATAHAHQDVTTEQRLQAINDHAARQKKRINPLVAAYELPGRLRDSVEAAPRTIAAVAQESKKGFGRFLGKIAHTSLAQAYENTAAVVRGTIARAQQDVEIVQSVLYLCQIAQHGDAQASDQAGLRRENVIDLLDRVRSR